MNTATAHAYKYDDTAPLPPATKLRRIACAEVAANDDTYHTGHFNQAIAEVIHLPLPHPSGDVAASAALQIRPTPCGCNPLPEGDLLAGSSPLRSDSVVGEGTNVAPCAAQTLEDTNGNRTALTDSDKAQTSGSGLTFYRSINMTEVVNITFSLILDSALIFDKNSSLANLAR